jgi:hypothetical protein
VYKTESFGRKMKNKAYCIPTYIYSIYDKKVNAWRADPLMCCCDRISSVIIENTEDYLDKYKFSFVSLSTGFIVFSSEGSVQRTYDSRASVYCTNFVIPKETIYGTMYSDDCFWFEVSPFSYFNYKEFSKTKLFDFSAREWRFAKDFLETYVNFYESL